MKKAVNYNNVHWGINPAPPHSTPLLKNTAPLFLAKSPLNLQTVQASPLFGQSPIHFGF